MGALVSLIMCPLTIPVKVLKIIMSILSLFWVILLIIVIVLVGVYWNKISGFFTDIKEQIDNVTNIANSTKVQIEKLTKKVDELSNKVT